MLKPLSIALVLASCWFYTYLFHDYLVESEWQNVFGLTRIVIPDTFLYAYLVDIDDFYTSVVLSGVKNSLGPSTLWYIAGFNWYVMCFINVLFIWAIVIYLEKLASAYGIRKPDIQWAILLFIFVPGTLYYSIGALKELPMMLLLLMSLYYYNRQAYLAALLSALLLVAFRYQLAIILIFVAVLPLVPRNRFRWAMYAMLMLAAIYPALEGFQVLEKETTETYREESGTEASLGGGAETIRNNLYVLSAVGVALRTAQSFLEPVLTIARDMSVAEDGFVSIFAIVQLATNVAFIPFALGFLLKLPRVWRGGDRVPPEVQSLYALVVISFILVGGFSFIHHRYLYPFFPILIIAALIPRARLKVPSFNALQPMVARPRTADIHA